MREPVNRLVPQNLLRTELSISDHPCLHTDSPKNDTHMTNGYARRAGLNFD
jgi:hypothetical protein